MFAMARLWRVPVIASITSRGRRRCDDHAAMTQPALDRFIAQAAERSRERAEPADCVLALAPLMLELIDQADTFLEPQHLRSDPRTTRAT